MKNVRRRKAPSPAGLLADRQYAMTIDDVAIVLGMSDHTACKLEHSALRKLALWADAAGLSPEFGLDAITPRRCEAATQAVRRVYGAGDDAPVCGSDGWWRIDGTYAIGTPRGTVVDLPVAYSFMRRSVGDSAPVYVSTQDEHQEIGTVTSMVRVREEVLFRSTGLLQAVRDIGAAARTHAVVQYVSGRDAEGRYSVPILLGVLISD